MNAVPPDILAKAYRSPGAGELAWRRGDLPSAMEALVKSGFAILGGELWLVRDPKENWTGLIPSRDGKVPFVWGWDTGSRMEGESWSGYCERTLEESLDGDACPR